MTRRTVTVFTLLLLVCAMLLASAASDGHRHKRDNSQAALRTAYERVRGSPYNVSYDSRAVLVDGERVLLLSGSIHYPRASPSMWPQLMQTARQGGLNTIQTYTFWNLHAAERDGPLDWTTGSRDLGAFLQAAQDAGLFVVLRIGPYICAEWYNAGLPLWLTTNASVALRYYEQGWLDAVDTWTRQVAAYVEPWLARHGGPIIMAQIENEYGGAGSDPLRQAYVQWCANLTRAVDIGVPWLMCREPDAPQPLIYAENGFYSDIDYVMQQQDERMQPAMWTENWPGWVQNWGNGKPNRPAEDVAYSLLAFVASGGSMHNQYMYFGGTNFGITSGNQGNGPDGLHAITQSYDYDGAVDEFGVPHEPKYSHLAEAQAALDAYSDALLAGPIAPPVDGADGCQLFLYNRSTTPVAFLANNGAYVNRTCALLGQQFAVPSWSVSVIDLSDMAVVYNSHTFSAATVAAERRYQKLLAQPASSWSPAASDIAQWHDAPAPWPNADVLTQVGPAEQLNATQYRSQYFWYVTDFTTGAASDAVLLGLSGVWDRFHAFVDDSPALAANTTVSSLVTFTLATPTLSAGTHTLRIRCALVGLDNVSQGPTFHSTKGLRGSVVVNGVDVTNNTWRHVTGLHGEALRVFDGGDVPWTPYNATAMQRPGGVWLRIAVPAPAVLGDAATATWQLDMSAMRRGLVYVNGFSVGVYWNIQATSGCGDCRYEGGYDPEQCRTGCSTGPSQAKYHVPRDVLRLQAGQSNEVVVFEEEGGDPLQIAFQQRT